MARKLWAGLDVGVETTRICVVDDAGEILREATCHTTLKEINRELSWLKRRRSARIGLEAGSGASIARGLRSLGYSVDLYEVRQLSSFLRARRNKTDAGDAQGIAEAGRVGAVLVSKVYLKSLECQSLQSRLTIRRHLVGQRMRAASLLCRQLELYGGRVRGPQKRRHLRENAEIEIRKLFGKNGSSPLQVEFRYLLDHVQRIEDHVRAMDRELAGLAFENELCRRFMEIPGVGPICALSFYAAVGEPHRFSRAADMGAYFGMTPRIHQSGLTTRQGRISKMGNKAVRSLLVQSSTSFMMWSGSNSALRAWALRIEARRGRGPSRVALARKLATIMLAMWKSGERFRADQTAGPSPGRPTRKADPDPGEPNAHSSAPFMVGPALPASAES
jgi:transposase